MKRKRTTGNRVWIGLLGFSLLVILVLDGAVIYLIAMRPESYPLFGFTGLPIMLGVTWTAWRALRRRLSISGSDSFF